MMLLCEVGMCVEEKKRYQRAGYILAVDLSMTTPDVDDSRMCWQDLGEEKLYVWSKCDLPMMV